MQDFFYALIITFSFFTFLPLPLVEWNAQRLKFVVFQIPLVGLFIGGCIYALFIFFDLLTVSTFSGAVLITIANLVITGGLHMDGLMDMADAYFSRADKERKLEIMKDSAAGAFAVMSFATVILLRITCYYELFQAEKDFAVLLIFIPILSRIIQAFILCSFPCAKAEGLAVTLRAGAGKKAQTMLIIWLIVLAVLIYCLAGLRALFLPGVLILFTVFYYFSVQRNFGGITGDIAGAFVEVSELLMLAVLLLI